MAWWHAGAVIAGLGDLTFHFLGYMLCALNCVVTAGYLVYIAKVKKETHLDTWGLMFYNNILSFPFVVLAVYLTELNSLFEYTRWTEIGFIVRAPPNAFTSFFFPFCIFLFASTFLSFFPSFLLSFFSAFKQVCFLMSSIQAFLLNYFIFLCSTINSPLATSVTGIFYFLFFIFK